LPFRLVTLGGTDLTRPDGVTLDAILSQPKRLAVLVYLVLSRPARFVRRDLLISLFWPELDQEHARGALRQAVRAIRREMGEAPLVNRGDEEIGFAEGAVACDAVEFLEARRAGHAESALALYAGDFLPGFHLEEAAPEFGAWLDDERARLRAFAADAASGAADLRKAAGETAVAVRLARRACELAPYDEGRLRVLMSLLDAAGDRAEALRAYEDFKSRVARDLEVSPSTSSRRLARDMRGRTTPTNPDPRRSGSSP
jgi:DNA-binding SARP family transcriptional activator